MGLVREVEVFYKTCNLCLLNITQIIHEESFNTGKGDKIPIALADTLQLNH